MEDLSNEARKENIRRAARRKVLVQLPGHVAAGVPSGTTAKAVVTYADSVLSEIESRFGADW